MDEIKEEIEWLIKDELEKGSTDKFGFILSHMRSKLVNMENLIKTHDTSLILLTHNAESRNKLIEDMNARLKKIEDESLKKEGVKTFLNNLIHYGPIIIFIVGCLYYTHFFEIVGEKAFGKFQNETQQESNQ